MIGHEAYAVTALQEFYKAYAAWLDADAPVEDYRYKFKRTVGLCGALKAYMIGEGMRPAYMDVLAVMDEQFQTAKLDVIFPFNDGSAYSYEREAQREWCHCNARRVNWVRERV